ncbi:hypothetical protein AA313_de0204778 [Arthrobotrys entomopaga]|nr:hypothetical protein AA313_de0204778 [Arthrobotrys entomopaga]
MCQTGHKAYNRCRETDPDKKHHFTVTVRCDPAIATGMRCEELRYGVDLALAGVELDCKVCSPYDLDFNPPPPPRNRHVVYRAVAITSAATPVSAESSSAGNPTPISSFSTREQSTSRSQSHLFGPSAPPVRDNIFSGGQQSAAGGFRPLFGNFVSADSGRSTSTASANPNFF